ncbi:MAG: helix-turn-helix domain-containing protein [Opitutales bacterium]|nr:helix-turn-helix domain-containing protein [Opitutales bacterium]
MQQTIGETLRELRKAKGLSMRRTAAAADLDQAALSRIENGRRLPTEAQLAALAAIYGQDLPKLLAINAFSEIKEKHGSAPYYADCVSLLHEDAAAYNRKPRSTAPPRPACE